MKFADLVNISELRELCESFTSLTGAVTAILDLEGNILIAAGWQDICVRFHRVNPQTACRCTESDTVLAGQLKKGEAYNVYKCRNGLVDVAVPIIVDGEHVANFFSGQFFFHPPDEDPFLLQAEEFGFDKRSYLEALRKVPVFSEQQVWMMMHFFTRLARVIGEMGLAEKRLQEANARLSCNQEHLEELVKQRTSEIASSEKKYLDLYENAPDMYLSTDAATGVIMQCNAALAAVIGSAREDIVGRPVSDIFHPDCAGEVRQAFELGDAHDRELILRRADGTLLDVSLNVSAAPDAKDALRCRQASLRDISERKRIEDSLRFIAQRGWISDAGDFLTALAGYLGKTFAVDYVIIDRLAADEPGCAETVALYAKGAILPSMRYPLGGTPCENVMGKVLCYYPQGVQSLFPSDHLLVEMGVEGYAGIPLWDSEGHAIGLIAVMDSKPLCDKSTLTSILQLVAASAAAALERERSDSLLRRREQEFRALAENSPDTIIRYDRECQRIYVNPAFEQTTGIPRTEALGLPSPDNWRCSMPLAEYLECLKQAMTSGAPAEIHFDWPDKDGNPAHQSLRIVPEHDNHGSVVGVLVIGRDITTLKKAQDELMKLNEQLELRVKERTTELEEKNRELYKMNRIFVGRELKMAELKERIKELENRSGEKSGYDAGA